MRNKKKKILYFGLDPTRFNPDGELVHLPLIRISPFPYAGVVKQTFEQLNSYTHVLMTSRTAVSLYYAYALQAGFSPKHLQNKEYLCVGRATAECLTEQICTSPLLPEEETAEGVVTLLQGVNLEEAHLFFPHSLSARRIIIDYLTERGARFTALPLYQPETRSVALPNLEKFDEFIFTSPSTVKAFVELTGMSPPKHKSIAIGPITQSYLSKSQSLKLLNMG